MSRQLSDLRLWVDGITEADVDLHADPGRIEQSTESNSDSLVVRILRDSFTVHSVGIEYKPIRFDINREHVSDLSDDICLRIARYSHHVDVHRRTDLWRVPYAQHQGALQDELLGVPGDVDRR